MSEANEDFMFQFVPLINEFEHASFNDFDKTAYGILGAICEQILAQCSPEKRNSSGIILRMFSEAVREKYKDGDCLESWDYLHSSLRIMIRQYFPEIVSRGYVNMVTGDIGTQVPLESQRAPMFANERRSGGKEYAQLVQQQCREARALTAPAAPASPARNDSAPVSADSLVSAIDAAIAASNASGGKFDADVWSSVNTLIACVASRHVLATSNADALLRAGEAMKALESLRTAQS